jgi:hypothetical protein
LCRNFFIENRVNAKRTFVALFLGGAILIFVAGCVGPESDAQPWNRPAGWEHGMPDVPHRQ